MNNTGKPINIKGTTNLYRRPVDHSETKAEEFSAIYEREVAEFCLNCTRKDCPHGTCKDYELFIYEYRRRKNGTET